MWFSQLKVFLSVTKVRDPFCMDLVLNEMRVYVTVVYHSI